MKYKQVALPYSFFERFNKIRPYLGYRNFSEFVVDKIRDAVKSEEFSASRLRDEIEEARKQEAESRNY